MKRYYPLLALLLLANLACQDVSTYETKIADLQAELDSTQVLLADAQASTEQDGKFIHTVYIWMKEDLTTAERDQFETAVQSLGEIESVRQFYWGRPADSEARAVVDHSYDYALAIHFDDLAGHDIYQPHEIHQAFVANNADLWTKVKVYDSWME
ncbi:MAG: Dabb family protein [Bacteroidota bacterium]